MSILLQTKVRRIVLTAMELHIMLYLADCGSDDGTHIFPSQRRIAWECAVNVRTVRKILKTMEGRGILEAVAYGKGGRGMATEYVMHLERGIPRPEFDPNDPACGGETKVLQNVAPDSAFTENVAPDSAFTENVARRSQKAESGSQNVARRSAQPLVTIREPLGEPLGEPTRTRENITPDVFDQAAEIWPPIREYLRRIIPARQRPWLLDAQFFPNLDSDGYVLVAPNEFMRDLMLGNWRNLVEMKAWEISRRRLPVSVMTAGEYQQQIMAHRDDDDAPEREAAEA